MKTYLLLFPSVHYVLKAERLLKAAGILTEMIPVPKEIKGDCGMALVIRAEDLEAVSRLLNDGNLRPEGCYEKKDQSYRLVHRFRNGKDHRDQ